MADQECINALTAYVAEQLDEGILKEQIAGTVLAQFNMDRAAAALFVEQVVAMRKEARQRQGVENVMFGILLALLGLGITIGTWYLAGPGGTYIVTFGLVVGGVFYVLLGLFRVVVNSVSLQATLRRVLVIALLIGIVGAGMVFAFSKTFGSE